MYRIYINEKPLIFISATVGKTLKSTKQDLVFRYMGRSNTLFPYIDNLEKSNQLNSITLFHDDVEQLFQDFCQLYKVLEAGGGVVFNEKSEILMIYRLGYWDLPKGKIEKGETQEIAAIREVQEETGLQEVDLKEHLITTYHTYRNRKNKRVLKVSHWYRMETKETELTPQIEEDIELAVWIDKDTFLSSGKKAYQNIFDVLDTLPKS